MRFRILGPITAERDGVQVSIARPRRRAVLAYLLLSANRPISTEDLIEAMWGGAPPSTARRQVHADISAIRSALRQRADLIRTFPFGYQITVADDELDLAEFRAKVGQANAETAAGDHKLAARVLRSALDLWSGPALADAVGAYVPAAAARLEEQRLDARERLIEVELAGGAAEEPISDLTGLIAQHPLRERLHGLLMLALYRAGRRLEALETARTLRATLAEQHGLDPGPEIIDLERRVLRDDPALRPQPASPVPAQLPLDIPGFVGRVDHLSALDSLLPPRRAVTVLTGMGGVGKTALAVHWAHRVRDRFPDGQLFVNLRGFDPTGTAMPTSEAIRRFLDALAVPDQRIPADPDSQVDLLRTLLADKRMLILLDNARDTDQVRPLLPGAPGCLVVVTSRNTLTGLVAADDAYPLSLDLLSDEEARDLLARRLGVAAVAAVPPGIVNEIVARCARLPLALAIVAARALTDAHLSLSTIADRLRGVDRLETLSTNDIASTDLATVFSWSYERLGHAAARLFTLLGLHPGSDTSVAAAASLAALPVKTAGWLLGDLTRAHLIEEHAPGRYSLHDLVRAYAVDLAHATVVEPDARAATHRLLDHYLHAAYAADRLLEPARDPIALDAAEPGVTPEHFADRAQALAWFTAEHANLRAAVNHAADQDFSTHCWQLAWSLFDYFDRHGHWHDLIAVHQTAAIATKQLADTAIQILIHRILARACIQLGRFEDANGHLEQALEQAQAVKDIMSQAHIHNSLGHLRDRSGRPEEALKCALLAVDLFRAVGHRHGEANTLNGVGWCYAMLGDHQNAVVHCQEALRLLQELDDRVGQSYAWDSLGFIHHQAGQHPQAVHCYETALGIARELRLHRNVAEHLAHLGDVHHATGNTRAAYDAWQQAVPILEEIDHPHTELFRNKLTSLELTAS